MGEGGIEDYLSSVPSVQKINLRPRTQIYPEVGRKVSLHSDDVGKDVGTWSRVAITHHLSLHHSSHSLPFGRDGLLKWGLLCRLFVKACGVSTVSPSYLCSSGTLWSFLTHRGGVG